MTAAPVSEFPYVEEYLDVLLRHGRKHITTDRYRQILGMILRGLHDMGRTTDPRRAAQAVALRNGYISHNGYVSNEREFESRNI